MGFRFLADSCDSSNLSVCFDVASAPERKGADLKAHSTLVETRVALEEVYSTFCALVLVRLPLVWILRHQQGDVVMHK